jgi:DNA-binding CsgD family transcriptional regulator
MDRAARLSDRGSSKRGIPAGEFRPQGVCPVISPEQGRDSRSRDVPPVAGLILLDCLQRPIYCNAEAHKILTYAAPSKRDASLEDLLPDEIRSMLLGPYPIGHTFCQAQFISGRRHYRCRTFPLFPLTRRPRQAASGLLIERSFPKPVEVSKVLGQYRLTHRERETVELLVLGLTSKEIAGRMQVSPNTVKTFFRLIMTKMGVCTRSGILGKIVRTPPA